jgi:hypothetical protein
MEISRRDEITFHTETGICEITLSCFLLEQAARIARPQKLADVRSVIFGSQKSWDRLS